MSINNLTSSYYNLSQQLASQSSSSGTSSSSDIDSLIKQLEGASTSTSSDSNDAFSLNLSQSAQDLLDSGSTNSTSSSSSTASYTLTKAQQKQLDAILAKYKDAPFTQDTYNQIQDELQKAGLAPDQLATEDKIKSFNTTQVFIDALNGKDDSSSSSTSSDGSTSSSDSTDSDTKSSNYMQQVVSQWKSISTTANADNSSTDQTSGSGISIDA